MPHNITRREFLRHSAAALAALWLAPLLPEPAGAAKAAAPRQASAAGPAFEPLPLPALLGAPADVAIGTDGVFWVLGESGAPSTYDPLQQVWEPFGGGIDAVAYIPFVDSNTNFSVALCFFRGGEVYKSGAPAPVPIASLWPNLPPSFQQGVDGASYLSGNTFYLFRHGQAAAVDVWGNVSVSSLTDFTGAGWPGGAWQDGRFDFVVSGKDDAFPGYAIFVRGGEYIVANLSQGLITSAPQPLSTQFGGAALALLAQAGLQAGLFAGAVLATAAPFKVFGGPVVYSLQDTQSTTPAQADYLAQAFSGWPAAWHPVLQQAPAGSLGTLWSVADGGMPILNDTTGWSPAPLPTNTPALAVDSGSDGSVYAITAGALYSLDAGGSGWTAAATTPLAVQQVSVGDANHVWVRDGQGNVYRFANGSFTQANLGVQATHVKANPDGTIWHCSGDQPNVYRYISEGQLPSEIIAVGLGVTSVQRAAGTSFGKAFFLAQQNGQNVLVRYTSPYLFKTSASYTTGFMRRIATGAASVFVPHISPDRTQITVSALDVHTGAERWAYQYAADQATAANFMEQQGAAALYDAQYQLLYVFQYRGVIDALDAHTGALRWSLSLAQLTLTQAVIPVQPLLVAGSLYVAAGDDPAAAPNSLKLYLIAIDTADAVTRAGAGQPVQARWVSANNVPDQSPVLPLPPVCFEGAIYQSAWSVGDPGMLMINTWQTDPATGSANSIWHNEFDPWPSAPPSITAPIVARLQMPHLTELAPAMVFNTGQAVYGMFLNNYDSIPSYNPSELAANGCYSNMVLFDGNIYFADRAGNLYGLDAAFNPLPNLPSTLVGDNMYAPVTVTRAGDGSAVVILGDTANDNLVFYGVASGNSLTLETSQTAFMSMSEVTGDGLLYGGGAGPDWSVGQFFGIRTADMSALRDFVIESQLMQDFDPSAVPVARYQTHISIVDDNQTPQPFMGVKIWSDDPLTLLVDGQSYTTGPDTPVSTAVDATGALTIISISDATDLFATPLRIWAAFMDPFERIVIFPDREFHGRLPSMIADPNNDDPTLVNLTGTNYAGTQIFTDQQQAQATASAVATTCQAAGIAGNTGASSGASLPPYVAYGDLPGMQYTPYNTPASRPAVPQSPYGLSWSSDTPAAYTVLPFAAAAGAIDALAGEVDPSLPSPVGSGLGSIFSDLWHKIKSGVAKVTKVIVSVGNAVYTGIQYVENGVTKVFRFVVRQIEDLAATVGAFFVALGKAIEDVVELLSLLLHFEEVVKTHTILKSAILQQIGGLFLTSTTTILPAVKGFFANGENTIEQAFCTVKQQIVPGFTCSAPGVGASPPVSGFTGIGATAHTIFSVAPKAGGGAKSHAVAATWGFDKVRSHYKQATTPGPAVTAGNPILDFVNSFANSLTTNATLQQAYTATLNDFAASFAFKSSTEFLQMAVFDLLDVIQDLLISSLAIGEAFLEGLLALAGDLVTFLIDPQQGILVQPLDIPILSDLYKWLFGSELTFLDLIVLVASIPVTFLYRIVEGQWLSKQVAGPVETAAQLSLTPLARALGLLNAAFFFGRGILMPINDTTSQPGAPNPITTPILGAISAGFCATALLKTAHASDLVFSVTALGLVLAPSFAVAAPAMAAFLSLVRIGAFIFDMVVKPSADALFALSGNVLGSLPALAQPLKYLNNATDDISLAILVLLEIIGNFGAGFVAVVDTTVNWDTAPTDLPPTDLPPTEEPVPNGSSRLHLPFVQTGP